jgi:hypothetical protein
MHSLPGDSWAHIAHTLAGLKVVRYRSESRAIVQRTKITSGLAKKKTLGVSKPKQILTAVEPATAPAAGFACAP